MSWVDGLAHGSASRFGFTEPYSIHPRTRKPAPWQLVLSGKEIGPYRLIADVMDAAGALWGAGPMLPTKLPYRVAVATIVSKGKTMPASSVCGSSASESSLVGRRPWPRGGRRYRCRRRHRARVPG